jgi:uncharacterized radical SAM superfamily protein
MKHVLIALFIGLGPTVIAQATCESFKEAIKEYREQETIDRRVDVADDCSSITIITWNNFDVGKMDIYGDDGVRKLLREAGGAFAGDVDNREAMLSMGIKRLYLKVLGEIEPRGYYDIEKEAITVY